MTVLINGTTGITTPGLTNDGSQTISTGTANGVTYLNGSKVLTSGSALTFDGTNLGVGTSSPAAKLEVSTSTGTEIRSTITGSAGNVARLRLKSPVADYAWYVADNANALVVYDYNAGAERARIDSSGNLLVGTTSQPGAGNTTKGVQVSPSGVVIACRNAASGYVGYWTITGGSGGIHEFYSGTTVVGSITTNGTSTAFNTSSDYRLKENIAPMTGALAKVAALKPVTYNWKVDGSAGEGFIAHELAEVCSQAVTGEKDAMDAEGKPQYQGIDVSFLVATLTAAIKEQQAIITALTARVTALEGN